MKRKGSWPKLSNVISRSAERGASIARIVFNPKRWNRASVASGGMALLQLWPAVILGLLLNVLDALSYGEFESHI